LPKKFFLDETYPLANLDPTAPAFIAPPDPGHRFGIMVRARNSEFGAVLVNIGYVIDYVTYAQGLAQAGIRHIELS
jgi:hypothetical protein